jgi:protein SCO1/2
VRIGSTFFQSVALSVVILSSLTIAVASPQPARMGVFTMPDAVIDMDLHFVDEEGRTVTLRDRVPRDKPFILVPIFYECPRLCGLTLSGVANLVNDLPLTLGKDYSVVSYSFNPVEGPKEAAAKRTSVLTRLKKPLRERRGWQFLSSSAEVINTLNGQLDFRVRMADKEFEHSSAIFIVEPEGHVRKYFAGVEFDPGKVRSALTGQK